MKSNSEINLNVPTISEYSLDGTVKNSDPKVVSNLENTYSVSNIGTKVESVHTPLSSVLTPSISNVSSESFSAISLGNHDSSDKFVNNNSTKVSIENNSNLRVNLANSSSIRSSSDQQKVRLNNLSMPVSSSLEQIRSPIAVPISPFLTKNNIPFVSPSSFNSQVLPFSKSQNSRQQFVATANNNNNNAFNNNSVISFMNQQNQLNSSQEQSKIQLQNSSFPILHSEPLQKSIPHTYHFLHQNLPLNYSKHVGLNSVQFNKQSMPIMNSSQQNLNANQFNSQNLPSLNLQFPPQLPTKFNPQTLDFSRNELTKNHPFFYQQQHPPQRPTIPQQPISSHQSLSLQPISMQQISQHPISQHPISQSSVSQHPISQQPISQHPISQHPISQQQPLHGYSHHINSVQFGQSQPNSLQNLFKQQNISQTQQHQDAQTEPFISQSQHLLNQPQQLLSQQQQLLSQSQQLLSQSQQVGMHESLTNSQNLQSVFENKNTSIFDKNNIQSLSVSDSNISSNNKTSETNVGNPESWESIGDTPWYRVETSEGLTYYYNKESNQSVWTCPEEIEMLVKELDGEISPIQSNINNITSINEKMNENEEIIEKKNENIDENEEYEEEMNQKFDILKNFKKLLKQKQFGPFETFQKSLPKLLYEKAFLAIPVDQRKFLFEKFIKEIANEKRKDRKENVENFRQFLKDLKEKHLIHSSSTVESLSKKYSNDALWKGDSSDEWNKIRNSLIEEEINFCQNIKKHKKDEDRQNFKVLVREVLTELPDASYIEIKKKLKLDERYTKVNSSLERSKIISQIKHEIDAKLNQKRKNEEKLNFDDEDLEKKRQKAAKNEAETTFMNLLVERIKNPFTLEEGVDVLPTKLLISDKRFELETLTSSEKFRLFKTFVEDFKFSRLKLFEQKLKTLGYNYVGLTFKEIFEALDDNKFFFGLPERDMRNSLDRWKRKMISELKEAFSTFLRQNPDITHETDINNLELIEDKLSDDIRYKRLDFISIQRRQVIEERINELKIAHQRNRR